MLRKRAGAALRSGARGASFRSPGFVVTITVKIHEAKTHLSDLLARVEAGEEVIIMRGDTPVARLMPLAAEEKPRRQPGRFKGVFDLDDRFFEPLPEDELEAWNNPK